MNELALSPAEQNETETIKLVMDTKSNFLELGNLLLENREHAYWSQNGHEGFGNYIESLSIGSYSWVTRLMDIARIVSHNILTEDEVLEIGTGKMALLLPRLKEGKVDIDTIELSKACTLSDLKLCLGHKVSELDHSHPIICPRCGHKFFPTLHAILDKDEQGVV